MKNTCIKVGILLAGITLVGCSTMSNQSSHTMKSEHHKEGKSMQTASNSSEDVGIARAGMDEADRSKLSHALDKAPGKSTHWTNANTNVAYTVTPIRAVTINGNPNCRKYSIVSVSNGASHESMGTACVGNDSAWKAV